jgi:hypothetical protein
MENSKPKIIISPNPTKTSVKIDFKTGKIIEKRVNGKIVNIESEEQPEEDKK